jgi:hypothetical protein
LKQDSISADSFPIENDYTLFEDKEGETKLQKNLPQLHKKNIWFVLRTGMWW